jgi:hypothetical protein
MPRTAIRRACWKNLSLVGVMVGDTVKVGVTVKLGVGVRV